MSDKYTTNTASIKSTLGDIKILNVKKLKVDGDDVLTIIKNNKTNILDERGTLANDELDIWNSSVITDEDGNVTIGAKVKPKEHTLGAITNTQQITLWKAAKVINNEVFDSDGNHLMYWQTGGLTKTDFKNFDAGRPLLGSGYYLTEFDSDLSSLVDGSNLFYASENLTSFKGDLSSLKGCIDMFWGCKKLKSFTSDMKLITNGEMMFYNCSNLETFDADLNSLENGEMMFWKDANLTSFKGDLSSLENGSYMFQMCSSLTSFTSKLSSLENGKQMFVNCKLDAASVGNIVSSLPVHETGGEIHLSVGCDSNIDDANLFAQECACDSYQDLLDEFTSKNWTANIGCSGRPTSTYSLRRGEPLPLYTKLIEVTDDAHYEYTSQDGSKLYNIEHFHLTNGSTEGYDVFETLEEAVIAYNVTHKTTER